MAEIILVFPKLLNWNYERDIPNSDTIPVGLLSIGSQLIDNGFKVRIIDADVDRDYLETVANELKDKNLLFVGVSAMTTQLGSALEIAGLVRNKRPEVPLVWGGIHPTLFPESTCAHQLADLVVVNEGVFTTLELAVRLKSKAELSELRGIVYKQNDKVIKTPPAVLRDVADLPFLNYELLDYEKYAKFNIDYNHKYGNIIKRSLAIHTGIGCPHRCTFCINTLLYQRQRRSKSAARIIQEIKILKNKYNLNHVSFRDEDFFASRRVVEEFINEAIAQRLEITWDTTVRADYFSENYLNQEFLAKVRKAGCVLLGIGVESASSRILEILLKDITVKNVEDSARLCRENDIFPYYSFMIGLPGETEKDTLQTLDFIEKIKKINNDAYIISPQMFRPYPGSVLYEECRRAGFEEPNSIDEWSQLNLAYTGYAGSKLPWVKNPDFIYHIVFFAEYGIKAKILPDWRVPFYLALRLSFWLRRKLGFWRWLLEFSVFQKLRKIKNRGKNE